MKILMFFLMISLVFSLSLCSYKDDENMVGVETRVYWDQSKCADPWKTGESHTNLQTTAALKAFLAEKDITVLTVIYEGPVPGLITCDSCGCGTGVRILVGCMADDVSKLEDLGFTVL